MKHESPALPVPLARAVMRAMPPAALERALAVVLRRMKSRRPRLFRNLAALKPAVVHVEPSDLPHRFVLTIGGGEARLDLLDPAAATAKPAALIRGALGALINMLEGRIDGDTLFFSRDLLISGDTAVIVALRNTLDREAINLTDDALSFLGPLAGPAARVMEVMNRVGARTRADLATFHDALHAAPTYAADRHLADECARLRAELEAVKTSLAKQDARQRRSGAAA